VTTKLNICRYWVSLTQLAGALFHTYEQTYVKTRYRGPAKNRAQLFPLFALGNLFLVRRRLLA